MSEAITTIPQNDALAFVENPDPAALEAVLAGGDISKLSTPQRLQFITAVCRSLRLNALTSPFEFMMINGKLRMYAKKDCTEQLRKIHNVSIKIRGRESKDDLYIVKAQATMPSGREDESLGAVSTKGKTGEDLANALMKAETKAKRRVTLAICGLGFLDESEVENLHRGAPSEDVGKVHDPFKDEAVEMEPVDATPPEPAPVWQDLYPTGWKSWLAAQQGSVTLADESDRALGMQWAADRNNPALCAFAASVIARNMAQIPDMEWPMITDAIPGLPENLEDCTPEQLWLVAGHLRKVRAAQEKVDAGK